jgi:hypothetical protein
LEDRFGHQGDDFLVTGTDQRGTQQLMMVGDLAVGMVFFQASGAVDLWGREKLDAVQGQQIMAIQKAKIFQGFAADQSSEDISEGGPELFGVDRIEDLAQASVTGYVFHVEDHPQVLLVLLSSLVEGQQGGIFESEHGQSTHRRIRQTDVRFSSSGIGDVAEGFTDVPEQGIRGKLFTRGGSLGHHQAPFSVRQTARFYVRSEQKECHPDVSLTACSASTASIAKGVLERPTTKDALVT